MAKKKREQIPPERALVVVPNQSRQVVVLERQPRARFEYMGVVFDPSESVGNHGGRPIAISEVKLKKLEEAFSYDASIKEACFYTGISEQTYYNWVQRWPVLLVRFEEMRQKPVMTARKTIVADLRNPSTAAWYLERKAKKEFKNALTIDPSEEVTKIIIKHIHIDQQANEREEEGTGVQPVAETEPSIELPTEQTND